jgi:hypothetical protein
MTFNIAPTLLAATLVALFAGSAQAVQITVEDPFVTTTSVAGASVETFNSSTGTCSTYVSCMGDFKIVSGSVGGKYAQPAGTSSAYLSVPNPERNGSATLDLGTTANYFGLYWGSIDTYNTLYFLLNGIVVDAFTGTEIATHIPGTANGNQSADTSNRYFNFFFGSQLFDAVKLESQGFAFETDNHAFATVTEPGTIALLAIGLTGLVIARRRKQV